MKTAGAQNNDDDDFEEDDEEAPLETDDTTQQEVENFLNQFLINSESSGLTDSVDLRLMLTALY